MSEHFENRKNEVALRRFAAVSFIEQKVREGLGVVQALRLAALRPWPDENGRYSSARTLEDYWYAWKSGGFAALQPKSRDDEGTFRKMPAEVGQWLLSQVSQYPEIPLKVLYERWTQAGQPLPSLRTLYRFLRSKGYDAASLRRGRLETGPTKAFEAPFVNDLWMTDFSPGPKLNIDGKVLTTHLCLILDDHSRLIAYGAYYLTADSYAFHQTLKQAVQRRGSRISSTPIVANHLLTNTPRLFVLTWGSVCCTRSLMRLGARVRWNDVFTRSNKVLKAP